MRAKEIKSAGDVEVADIDVPFLMRLQGLDEAGAFFGDVGRLPGQESRRFEDAVDAGRAASDDIGVEHHEGQAAIAFERMSAGRRRRCGAFSSSVSQWSRGTQALCSLTLPKRCDPVVVLAGADADPGQEATDGDLGLVAPVADEIDELIAGVVGNPAAC